MNAATLLNPIAKWFRPNNGEGDAMVRERGFAVLEWVSIITLLIMLAVTANIISSRTVANGVLPAAWAATLLIANLVPAMLVLVLLARRIAKHRARQSIAGSEGLYHTRLVGLFAFVAAVPTLLVVLFASLMFQYGVEFWYSERARSVLENANELAQGYRDQSAENVRAETVAMAKDMRISLSEDAQDSTKFAEAYGFQVLIRRFQESAIFERGSDGVLRTIVGVDLAEGELAERITDQMFDDIAKGQDVSLVYGSDSIKALSPVDLQSNIFIFTSRASSQSSLSQWERAEAILVDYDILAGRTQSLQLRFNGALYIASLLLLAVALWVALKFADRLVAPLAELVAASREVSQGNFAARVKTENSRDELAIMSRAFNSMTERLDGQHKALVQANHQLDDRRAFMQTVVESVTAGIISIDDADHIQLMNSAAEALLLDNDRNYHARPLADIAPFLSDLLATGQGSGVVQYRLHNDLITLAVRIGEGGMGKVITFEDITQQLLDQRQAAWSDVARRIAHEIKNPLTPIQLAAERIKRRFGSQITEGEDVFNQLTETIVRQVGDLRRMVDEFSSFARMPKPVFREENIVDLVSQAVFMQKVAHSDIVFDAPNNDTVLELACDRRQISQAITNILKNAVEAIQSRDEAHSENGNADKDSNAGVICVDITQDDQKIIIDISDNGIGLPEDYDHIFEPYVTTRAKGTGLGLAIVKKIVEEHFGTIEFSASQTGGAKVTLSFDRTKMTADEMIDNDLQNEHGA
jgi:two-component system nitrogen regulation sensor histidine kinase NtrY